MDEFSRRQEPIEPVDLVKEKEHHGGQLDKDDGGEFPPEELDMTLHEAFNADYTDSKGRVIVPDTIASFTDDEIELIRDDRAKKAAASQARREEMAEEQAKHPHKKLWIGLGTAAAGVATIVGIGLGLNNSGRDSNAAATGQQPTATAPAVPGATGQQTTSPETRPYSNLTIGNFPFRDSDGTVHEGLAAFQRTHELPVSQYTGDNVANLLPDVMKLINQWISAGADAQTDATYANLSGPTGAKGAWAVEHFYDEAFAQTLSDNPSFTEAMTSSHAVYVGSALSIRGTTSREYGANYQERLIASTGTSEVKRYDIVLQMIENIPGTHEPAQAIRFTLEQSVGSNGQPVWKVAQWGPSPAGK